MLLSQKSQTSQIVISDEEMNKMLEGVNLTSQFLNFNQEIQPRALEITQENNVCLTGDRICLKQMYEDISQLKKCLKSLSDNMRDEYKTMIETLSQVQKSQIEMSINYAQAMNESFKMNMDAMNSFKRDRKSIETGDGTNYKSEPRLSEGSKIDTIPPQSNENFLDDINDDELNDILNNMNSQKSFRNRMILKMMNLIHF
jgi:flagellar motility protein MotE (MotC chaperone)